LPANACSRTLDFDPGPGGRWRRSAADLRSSGLPSLHKKPKVFLLARRWSLMPLNGAAARRGLAQCQRSGEVFTIRVAFHQAAGTPLLSLREWRWEHTRGHKGPARELSSNLQRLSGWHHARPRGAVCAFSGIRDPHRVSKETEALCDARGSGSDAGQPQNARTATWGRGESVLALVELKVRGQARSHRQGPLPQAGPAPTGMACAYTSESVVTMSVSAASSAGNFHWKPAACSRAGKAFVLPSIRPAR